MPKQGFTVTVDGAEADIERVRVSGTTVELELEMDDYVDFGDSVTVAYAPPSAGYIQDRAGNRAARIQAGDIAVQSNVIDPNETVPPSPTSASVVADGTEVRINFDEPVEFSDYPPGMVVSLQHTGRGNGTSTWSWEAPEEVEGSAGAATGYEYRYRQVDGAWSSWTAITTTTVEISGLDNEVEYEIAVRATNAAGAGSPVTDTASALPMLAAHIQAIFNRYSGFFISFSRSGATTGIEDADGNAITGIDRWLGEWHNGTNWQALTTTIVNVRWITMGHPDGDFGAGEQMFRVRPITSAGLALTSWYNWTGSR